MIDKLLALAAVEHRQRLERPEPVALAAIVREALEQCSQRLDRSGAKLLLDLEPNLPPVRGDAFLLRQALINLIDNAADFSPRGGEIVLRLQRDGEYQRVDISDRGPGIPDYALSRVFERFYSLPRPSGGSRSSGLGLCFVAEVASLHGGETELVNREEGGARASLIVRG
jgi:two-component system sensor histidine kinase CreC